MSPISRELLNRYIQDDCTAEEREAVHRWLDENDLEDYEVAPHSGRMAHKALMNWDLLTDKLEELRPVSVPARRLFTWRKVAAACIGIALLGGGVWFYFTYKPRSLTYQTTYGEIKRINLPDGTIVTLNARSMLSITPGFNQLNRTVYLEGEAYFQVKGKAAIPFIVRPGTPKRATGLMVTVLGTSFDVSAFSDDPTIAIALKEGKVSVNPPGSGAPGDGEMVLAPGEEAVFHKNSRRLVLEKKFNPKARLAWQGQDLYFQDADIAEVLRKLERFYGVSFSTTSLRSRQWHLSGEYRRQTLTDVLESLSFNYNIGYRIQGTKVILFDQ